MACEATLALDERELVCALEEGHVGPIHVTEDGEAWGDITLPAAHHVDPDSTSL